MKVDLNCDVGEGVGDDAGVMPSVTSANVACGFHAGGPEAMRRTVRLARAHGVAIGAHPSFPDRAGFGRRLLAASPDEVRDDVTYQVGALWAFCRSEGVRLSHVKPHGALYNAAAVDPALARAVCEAARDVDPALTVVCLAGSRMVDVARSLGVPCAEEAFADRGYTARGALAPRDAPGGVLTDPAQVADRVSRMVREHRVATVDGAELAIDAQTICIHGDNPAAAAIAAAVRRRLESDGVSVGPVAPPA